jgi:hypothetical protein
VTFSPAAGRQNLAVPITMTVREFLASGGVDAAWLRN